MEKRVLVLNLDHYPIAVVPVQKAMVLLLMEKAQQLSNYELPLPAALPILRLSDWYITNTFPTKVCCSTGPICFVGTEANASIAAA